MTDWFCLVLGIVGTLLCVCLFALNDFDFDKVMFVDEEDD